MIGQRHVLGDSVATIEVVGTEWRAGVGTPVAFVRCPDLGPGLKRLAGNQLYALGPVIGPTHEHLCLIGKKTA